MFGLSNTPLLVGVTVGSYLIFGVLYAVMYKATSRSYYQLVKIMRQRIVLALGLTLLAIVAVPLAVFLGIAGLIWKIMNWLLERSDVQ